MTTEGSALLMSLQKKVPPQKLPETAENQSSKRSTVGKESAKFSPTHSQRLRSISEKYFKISSLDRNPQLEREDCFSIFQEDVKNSVPTTPQICGQNKEPLTFGGRSQRHHEPIGSLCPFPIGCFSVVTSFSTVL